MTTVYTTTGSTSLGGTAGSAGLVQKAYDRLIEFALRAQPLIRQVRVLLLHCNAMLTWHRTPLLLLRTLTRMQ